MKKHLCTEKAGELYICIVKDKELWFLPISSLEKPLNLTKPIDLANKITYTGSRFKPGDTSIEGVDVEKVWQVKIGSVWVSNVNEQYSDHYIQLHKYPTRQVFIDKQPTQKQLITEIIREDEKDGLYETTEKLVSVIPRAGQTTERCPKCRTTDFDSCHSMSCPIRDQTTEQGEKKEPWTRLDSTKTSFLSILEENYQITKSEHTPSYYENYTPLEAVQETYADLIAIYKANYAVPSQPVNKGEEESLESLNERKRQLNKQIDDLKGQLKVVKNKIFKIEYPHGAF